MLVDVKVVFLEEVGEQDAVSFLAFHPEPQTPSQGPERLCACGQQLWVVIIIMVELCYLLHTSAQPAAGMSLPAKKWNQAFITTSPYIFYMTLCSLSMRTINYGHLSLEGISELIQIP